MRVFDCCLQTEREKTKRVSRYSLQVIFAVCNLRFACCGINVVDDGDVDERPVMDNGMNFEQIHTAIDNNKTEE